MSDWVTGKPLTNGELEILTAVGYLVMKWNYAEHCARQILRGYLQGTSIDDPDHLKLSSRNARWIEQELRDEVLPRWTGVGARHLTRLVEAYASARPHRNRIVHGLQMTADAGSGAQAFLLHTMPQSRKSASPDLVRIAEFAPLIAHFTELAEFSQNVLVAFDQCGNLATNKDGTLVLPHLPPLIDVLSPPTYTHF